jgi:hypothetical protein
MIVGAATATNPVEYRVLRGKLTVNQIVNKFLAFYSIRKCIMLYPRD